MWVGWVKTWVTLEEGLYSQGNVGHGDPLVGQGLSNRISEKGRCESDPMVDKKEKRVTALTTSELPSSSNVPFRFSESGALPCAKSEAKMSAIRIRTCVEKNNTWSG